MDNVKSQEVPVLTPPEGMVEMGQTKETSEKTPNTEVETKTADVVAEQTEAPKEETPQEEKVEEAKEFQMPEKFKDKSAEEIAKSYVDLETHNKKVEMEKAEVDKFIQEAYATSEEEPSPKTPTTETKVEGEEPSPMTREQALKQVAEELRPILREEMNRTMTPQIARLEIKDMVDKYGDSFKAVANKVAASKKANPSLSLEDAYKLVTYDTVGRISEIKGIKKASQTAEEKIKAQVESSRPSGLKPVGIEEAVADPNVSVEELAEAVPELKPFAEISKQRRKM